MAAKCWKCIQIKEGNADIGTKLNRKKSDEYHLSSERYTIQFDFLLDGERDSAFNISKRHFENTAIIYKLLLRQSVRELEGQ